MKTNEALSILSITETTITLEVVKKAYREASKKYHPDVNPAGLNIMKMVNNAYETLLKATFPIELERPVNQTYGQEIEKALSAVSKIDGIIIEVIGCWIWLTGAKEIFQAHKKILKTPIFEHEPKSRFFYSAKKMAWYYSPRSEKKRFYRGKKTIEELRKIYGSSVYKNQSMAIA